MPSERSLFRKIQTTIEIAKSVKVSSLKELCQMVRDLGPDIFITRHYDLKQSAQVSQISQESIKRTVIFCRALDLLTDKGLLNSVGREATRRSRFSAIIASQVRFILAQNGIKIGAVNAMIRTKLHADKPVLPTADALWDDLQPDINRGMFAKLLTLLVNCNEGQYSQKKVYLHFNERSNSLRFQLLRSLFVSPLNLP